MRAANSSYYHDINAPLIGIWRQHADDAQQAFSAALVPTLQHALPALEKLYASWEKAAAKPRYRSFIPSLKAGMAKLDTYYQRSAESDAHIMAMGDIQITCFFFVR